MSVRICPIDAIDLAFEPRPWPFVQARRAEIDAYFRDLQRRKPEVWNGRVLLAHRREVRGGVLRGGYLETDFASFAAWRAWGRAEAGVSDCYGCAAVLSSDGYFLLGVMGEATANAGLAYFPCGTPDHGDIRGGKVDLAFSVARELREETGLDANALAPGPGWTMIERPGEITLVKLLRSAEPAAALRSRILRTLAAQARPELADIRIVRDASDCDAAVPAFVTDFITHVHTSRGALA